MSDPTPHWALAEDGDGWWHAAPVGGAGAAGRYADPAPTPGSGGPAGRYADGGGGVAGSYARP
ncbi:hypothetical protein ACFXO4_28820, partial [Streptomyces goshikiensis]